MEQRHDETNRYCSSSVRSSCSWEMFNSGCGIGHGDDRFRDQGPSSEIVDLFGSKKMVSDLNSGLSKKAFVFGLKVRDKEIRVDQVSANNHPQNGAFMSVNDKFGDRESEKVLVQTKNGDNSSQSGSFNHLEKDAYGSQSGEESGVKSISAYRGQAEKEFRVEVEAISHVRHKNLVRLLGYCIEGTHRLAYLHEAIEPKVVHRDIKSSNILIDEDFNAKRHMVKGTVFATDASVAYVDITVKTTIYLALQQARIHKNKSVEEAGITHCLREEFVIVGQNEADDL
ncbi:receptor protein kinase [Spatholobus suberectus]|nr:receptor protein kinase [Spatholobus suberectus]